MTFYFEVTVAY